MTLRQKLLLTFAGAHLLLVAYSAAGLPLPGFGNPLGASLRWYGAMTGATNRYGFFKEVGCGCKVTFHLADAVGKTWTDGLNRSGNHEAEMRYQSSQYLVLEFGDELAAHWAAAMFGRHPGATQVGVQFEQLEPPSLPAYRAGARPEWRTTYYRVFLRTDRLPTTAGE
jgi:hypothetical protein